MVAVASLLMLTGCDSWRSVELRNARTVEVDVDFSLPSAFSQLDCKTHERVKAGDALGVRIPPGESVCFEGPNMGLPYHWAEVKNLLVTMKTSEGTCATLNGPSLDAASNKDDVVLIDDRRCGSAP